MYSLVRHNRPKAKPSFAWSCMLPGQTSKGPPKGPPAENGVSKGQHSTNFFKISSIIQKPLSGFWFFFYFDSIINYWQKICMKPHMQLYASFDTSHLTCTLNVGHRWCSWHRQTLNGAHCDTKSINSRAYSSCITKYQYETQFLF